MFDYVDGKTDWFAYGLPSEGRSTVAPRIGDVARRDVPTCRLSDPISDVLKRARAAGWKVCVVVSDDNIVLGLLLDDALHADPRLPIEQVMESGPSTFRPNVSVEEITSYMRDHHLDSVLVTTPDGRLVGWLDRISADAALDRVPDVPAGRS